ncbi:hypothetical protein [Escherichia coli]|uniref:hypothetical protein n=1 Tax=Escherichia coli TaxID=562 RepID=UPI0020772F1D|nr:hypothetical protein [Escherichia coli]
MEKLSIELDAAKQRIAELESERVVLAAENAELKSVHPQPFGAEMMKALDAYEKHQDEVPETGMLNAFFILRDSIRVETPATDAFLAEVRAQGVEMYADNLDNAADDAERGGFDYAVKFLRSEASGVRLFADQLRKGGNQ